MAQKGNKYAEKNPKLPNGWEQVVLDWYKEGASDIEVAYRINENLTKFSYYLFKRLVNESNQFSAVINKGRQLLEDHLRNGGSYSASPIRLSRRKSMERSHKKKVLSSAEKLNQSMRVLISYHMKNPLVNSKRYVVFKRMGRTKRQFIAIFESRFAEGMTWGNYGAWELDHIMPVSSFDLNNPKEFKKCWSVGNLQPLWTRENLKKWAHRKETVTQ